MGYRNRPHAHRISARICIEPGIADHEAPDGQRPSPHCPADRRMRAAIAARRCFRDPHGWIEHRLSHCRSGRRGVSARRQRSHTRDRGPVGYGRRIQKALSRRDRYHERFTADPERRDGEVSRGRHRLHRAADRVRRHHRRRESGERLGQIAHRRGPEEDVGAGRAGEDHELEAGSPRVARDAPDALRAGRRFGHVRLFHRSGQS